MYKYEDHQFSFEKDWFIIPEVDKNHEIIRLADTINWNNLTNRMAKFFCRDNGRPTKPTRTKTGLLLN